MSARQDDISTLAAFVAHTLETDPDLAAQVEALRARDEPLLDVAEVADRLGIPASTVRAMARDDRLPAYPVARQWRFLWSEVRAAVMNGRVA